MKIIITSVCLSFMLLCSAISAKAETYYVVSGDEFKLTPLVSTLFSYAWKLDGVNALPAELGAGGAYTKILTLASPLVPETKTLSLAVLETAAGCLSNLVTHTIVILPKVTVSLTSPQDNFCVGLPVNTTLTANVDVVTGLGALNITLSPFVWTKDGVVVTGAATESLAITTAGSYKALVTYVLPATGVASSKVLTAITGTAKTILNNLPLPTVPGITIN